MESVTLLAATDGDARAPQASFDRALILSDATRLARDLVNEPPNHLTPTALADRAVGLAGERGLQSRVFGPAELAEQGFGALLGVSQGSAEELRFHRAGARRRGSDRRSAGPGGQGSHLRQRRPVAEDRRRHGGHEDRIDERAPRVRRLTLRSSVADLDGWQRAAKIGFRSPGELGREAIATRADATLRERAP